MLETLRARDLFLDLHALRLGGACVAWDELVGSALDTISWQ